MMSSEIVTSLELGRPLNIVLLDNHGFSSIGGLSQSVGSGGFGTDYRAPVDFAALAAGMGAETVRVRTHEELRAALAQLRLCPRTSVIVVETDKEARVGGYGSWWDVPPAEVSENPAVREARATFEQAVKQERSFLESPRD
jgi:3D-(3,5/4)-trihydroxycyclohexane-1,2-dione acylhydrolase (decyclizing)